jgi:hypothetical protein
LNDFRCFLNGLFLEIGAALMKNNLIKTLLLIILLLLAIVLGKIIGAACVGIKYAAWLGASTKFGFSPLAVDLSVVNFTFGIMININVAQAVLLLIAILSYTKIRAKG